MKTNTRKIIGQIPCALCLLFAIATASVNLRAATLTVTSIADSGPGTLRAALASTANGDTINFALPMPSRITLTSGELLVTNSVSILGPGAKNLALDGNAASRVFHIAPSNTVTIANLTVTNGVAGDLGVHGRSGGGIYNDHATLVVSNCSLISNTAANAGGGIFNDGFLAGSATLRIVNSTLGGNISDFGGGISTLGDSGSAEVEIFNCTLSRNSGQAGNNIYQEADDRGSAHLRIFNCTLNNSDNSVEGANIRVREYSSVEIGSTILLNTYRGIENNDFRPGTVSSLGFNLSSDDGSGFLTNATDQINTDPMLGPLQDNGGPTPTHALLGCSSAIDNGRNFSGSATDQRGAAFARIFDDAVANATGGDGTDIGAFEAQAHVPDTVPPNITCPADITVTETPGQGSRVVTFAPDVSDNCDSSPAVTCTPLSGSMFSLGTTAVTCIVADASGNSNQCSFLVTVCPITITVTTTNDDGPGSLRQAILDANDCPGKNIIEFAPSVCGTILLTSGGGFWISDELEIHGPGPTNLVLDGLAATTVFVNESDTTLSGLTITNGYGFAGFPGGILNGATLIISNCVVSGNSTDTTGGGIRNETEGDRDAVMTILNSTLNGNSTSESVELGSGRGGAIFNSGLWGHDARVTVFNSTVIGNTADFGGGGICNIAGPSSSATLIVSNSTLSKNLAGVVGGGIYAASAGSSDIQIANSTLSGNSAGLAGGIFNQGGPGLGIVVNITNSTLSGNTATNGGGGCIWNQEATVTIVNSTLSGNSAEGGPGGAIFNGFNGGTILEIGSTILSVGASGGTIVNDGATVISLGFNLSGDDGGGVLTNATDRINIDPMLGPLQDNGGPTFTHALLCGSPAIDKGKNFSATSIDQRGLPRSFDRPQNPNAAGGDGTDIGAFEVQQFCTPFLSNFGMASNRFGFDINAESNQLAVVESSINLTTWNPLATNTVGGTPLRFSDPAPADLPKRFYRARTQ